MHHWFRNSVDPCDLSTGKQQCSLYIYEGIFPPNLKFSKTYSGIMGLNGSYKWAPQLFYRPLQYIGSYNNPRTIKDKYYAY